MGAQEHEWIYDSFSMGQGSSTGYRFLIQVVEGLGQPDYRTEVIPKAGMDGSWVYSKWMAESVIILNGEYAVVDGDGPNQAYDDVFNEFLPAFPPAGDTDKSLQFNYPGWGPHKIMCKVSRSPHIDIDRILSLGTGPFVLEFTAGDPTIESDA